MEWRLVAKWEQQDSLEELRACRKQIPWTLLGLLLLLVWDSQLKEVQTKILVEELLLALALT